eukprot:1420568-Alexandrium_andersonii.AAC.1
MALAVGHLRALELARRQQGTCAVAQVQCSHDQNLGGPSSEPPEAAAQRTPEQVEPQQPIVGQQQV